MRFPLAHPDRLSCTRPFLAWGLTVLGLCGTAVAQDQPGFPADPKRNTRAPSVDRNLQGREDGQRFRPLSRMMKDQLQSRGISEARIQALEAGIAGQSLEIGSELHDLYLQAKDVEDSQRDDPRLLQKPIPNLITAEEIAAGITLADKGTGRAMNPGSHVRIEASLQPERLGPNEPGKIVLVMTMREDAVMKSPAPLAFHHKPRQGLVEMGDPVIKAAHPARYAPFFRGAPAYDEYVLVEIPIKVNGILKSTLRANLDLEFALHHGTTGEPLGVYRHTASVKVPVGSSMPKAFAGSGSRGIRDSGFVEASATRMDTPTTVGGAAPVERIADPGSTAAGAATQEPAEDVEPVLSAPSGGDGLLLLGVGGLVLLGILGLLLRSRR